MQKFDYNTYSFAFGGNDGTLSGADVYLIKDIIDSNDIYMIPNVNKPIVTRTAISKLYKFFGFIEQQPLVTSLENGERVEIFKEREKETPLVVKNSIVYANVPFRDPKRDVMFFGDGEASDINLTNEISRSYPIAMAIKRARGRAVLNYLGIDAYGEDEADSFSKARPSQLSDKDLESMKDPLAKRKLLDHISYLAATASQPLDKSELGIFVRNVLGLPEDKKITISSLNFDHLIKIVVALEIHNHLDSDTLMGYINAKNQTSQETSQENQTAQDKDKTE